MSRLLLPAILLLALLGCGSNHVAVEQGKILSPTDNLPRHITHLTHFGQRADWSHDGKRILFIEKTFGDVYEVDLKTKTGHSEQSEESQSMIHELIITKNLREAAQPMQYTSLFANGYRI